VPVHDTVPVTDDISVTLHEAGHILGSVTVLLETQGTRTLFSGDLGRPTHPLLPWREAPPAADVVVVESTYGDRHHPDPESDVLADAVRRTVARGGVVLVPAFAIDRTELVLLKLGRLMREGSIPIVPVFVNSPMAVAALDIYRAAMASSGFAGTDVGPDFGLPDLRTVRDRTASERLNHPESPCIVVSASGMATGGRVVHHLAAQLPEPRNCVVLTGYQAAGTRGRDLAEGVPQVKIHGRHVPVRAEIVVDPSFSVHADADEILAWLRLLRDEPRVVYLVHGEPEPAAALGTRVAEELGWTAVVPRHGERVRLD
jgi:metallo-beta-lactamase family protein